jgi:hypothetical protein
VSATEVGTGTINVGGRDEMGRRVTRQVQLTTRVSETGEPVSVKTDDGRTITVSKKLADLYPERFEPVKSASAKKGDEE